MDCGPRLAEVIDPIRRDPEPVKSLAILEALAETGQPLKADWILPGLAAAEAEYFAQTWRSENDFFASRSDSERFVVQYGSKMKPKWTQYG